MCTKLARIFNFMGFKCFHKGQDCKVDNIKVTSLSYIFLQYSIIWQTKVFENYISGKTFRKKKSEINCPIRYERELERHYNDSVGFCMVQAMHIPAL